MNNKAKTLIERVAAGESPALALREAAGDWKALAADTQKQVDAAEKAFQKLYTKGIFGSGLPAGVASKFNDLAVEQAHISTRLSILIKDAKEGKSK